MKGRDYYKIRANLTEFAKQNKLPTYSIDCLYAIYKLGNNPSNPNYQRQVASFIRVSESLVSFGVKRLIKANLVKHSKGSNRLRTLVELTEDGEKLAQKIEQEKVFI